MAIAPFVPPAWISSLPSAIWSGVDGLPVFPYLPGQNPAISKTPTFSTTVLKSASGRRRVTQNWPFPLYSFEVSYEVIRHRATNDELTIMWEFFNTMKGAAGSFLFVDPGDCQILSTAPVQFAVGDGTTKTFQLGRTLNSLLEPVSNVYLPVILNNAVVVAQPGACSVANGQVTFVTAPIAGHLLTWYGYYYFGCCFLGDDVTFAQIMAPLWEGRSVKMESLRI